jgi:hypothetical protein
MNTIVWKISNLTVLPAEGSLTDIVITAFWSVTATSPQGTVAQLEGSCRFSPPDPENFTPYPKLAEAEVIGWVQAEMGPTAVNSLILSLDGEIASKENPPPCPIPMPLPWSPAP